MEDRGVRGMVLVHTGSGQRSGCGESWGDGSKDILLEGQMAVQALGGDGGRHDRALSCELLRGWSLSGLSFLCLNLFATCPATPPPGGAPVVRSALHSPQPLQANPNLVESLRRPPRW